MELKKNLDNRPILDGHFEFLNFEPKFIKLYNTKIHKNQPRWWAFQIFIHFEFPHIIFKFVFRDL